MTEAPGQPRDNPETVILILREQVYPVAPGIDLRTALQKFAIPSEAVLAIRNGERIAEDVILRPGDRVKLVHVISGGGTADR
jgi:sulfur carrier protein ThiS